MANEETKNQKNELYNIVSFHLRFHKCCISYPCPMLAEIIKETIENRQEEHNGETRGKVANAVSKFMYNITAEFKSTRKNNKINN